MNNNIENTASGNEITDKNPLSVRISQEHKDKFFKSLENYKEQLKAEYKSEKFTQKDMLELIIDYFVEDNKNLYDLFDFSGVIKDMKHHIFSISAIFSTIQEQANNKLKSERSIFDNIQSSLKNEIAALSIKSEDLEKENSKLLEDKNNLRNQLDTANDHFNVTIDKISKSSEEAIEKLNSKIEQLNEQLSIKDKEYSSLLLKYNDCLEHEKELTTIKSEYEKLKPITEAQTIDIIRLNKKLESIKDDYKDLERINNKKISTFEDTITSLNRNKEDIRTEVEKTLRKEYELSNKESLIDLKEKYSDLLTKYNDLQLEQIKYLRENKR